MVGAAIAVLVLIYVHRCGPTCSSTGSSSLVSEWLLLVLVSIGAILCICLFQLGHLGIGRVHLVFEVFRLRLDHLELFHELTGRQRLVCLLLSVRAASFSLDLVHMLL